MSTKSADLDTIRDDVAQLREDLKSLMGTVAAIGHDVAGAAGGRTHRLVDDLEKRAAKSYDRISDEASRYANTVEKQIAEHPVGTAAIALAIGLVISRLLDRSHPR
jgi:ElaB/YqjD/DUF883 family membrane-anchored ribosome-binding protein